MIKPYVVRELLEDEDVFGYILNGCHADAYDHQAQFINDRLSKDLTVAQIAKIVWSGFYLELFVNDGFIVDRKQAEAVMGGSERFLGIAKKIREKMEF